METSRDSSAWRSLAVTFGGGLALGAVGMRLTQTALRPAELAPRPDTNPVDDRIERLERRLEMMERAPSTAQPSVSSQIDQKVLEAIVGAVEARIQEHAGKVERRIADLEAKVAVELQSLYQRSRGGDDATDKIAEVQANLRLQMLGMRSALELDIRQLAESVSRTGTAQTAMRSEVQTLHQQNERLLDSTEQRFADMRYDYRQELTALRGTVDEEISQRTKDSERLMATEMAAFCITLEKSLETRVVTTAAAAAASQLEDQLAPLRAEVQRKETELSELRQRLAESERSVLDVILAIGQLCRQAADRIASPVHKPASSELTQAEVEMEAGAPEAPPAVEEPGSELQPESQPATMGPPGPVALPMPQAAVDLPSFLQDRKGNSSWRIPLVSSLLVTTGLLTTGLYLLHSL